MHIDFSATGQSYRCIRVKEGLASFGEGAFTRLPYSLRVFAENILRTTPETDRARALRALQDRRKDVDFVFQPARVVLQDMLGTPALVDLAGLRDAIAERGGDPARVNPRVPVDLVIDHSVIVEHTGAGALERNMAAERRRNGERFEFFEWSQKAFANVRVLPPGNGILHQVNLEHLSPVVRTAAGDGLPLAFPDTLVGTDSHTPMINALGVLGWGVGGIEAEAVMLGRGIRMRVPETIGVHLHGRLPHSVLATDLALALAERLRAENVVGSILEFRGPGVNTLTVPDRATVSNMAPEYGATACLFAIDARTIEYLELTGRSYRQCRLVEAYARLQGLWADALDAAEYDRRIDFDLGTVTRALAGPREPHQRIALRTLGARGMKRERAPGAAELADGAVVIAAITSCTNTSNPQGLVAAGLLARKACERGLRRAPWVKTSLAPGSRAVMGYLESAGLYAPLQSLGFDLVGFGCTTCAGMSGPLLRDAAEDIVARKLKVAAVLSGNRNFDGRIHPLVRDAFLASAPLVVAYALAGTVNVDLEQEPLAVDSGGSDVYLRDIWPSDAEIEEVMRRHVTAEHFRRAYGSEAATTDEDASAMQSATPARFAWRDASTYIRRPPYWHDGYARPPALQGMRPLAILGDNITTDHISPAGAIAVESAAGRLLRERGVEPEEFNAYGTRRGNHEVMMRATFANIRLRNEMTPELEGPYTMVHPEGRIVPLFEAASRYRERNESLVVIAGRNYGCGSSRDWAAKGVRLLGVAAVLAESFERIHRSNLAGMGVLPLEFAPGTTRHTLGLEGSETFDLERVPDNLAPGAPLRLAIRRSNATSQEVPVICRLQTQEEIEYIRAGGLLPLMRRELLEAPLNR